MLNAFVSIRTTLQTMFTTMSNSKVAQIHYNYSIALRTNSNIESMTSKLLV